MNNLVSIIANDPKPLRPQPFTLEHLDESANIKQWMENEFITYLSKASVTGEDIWHRLAFLMGAKLVSNQNTAKIENTFGMIFHQAMTEEPIGDSAFSLVYVYNVDQTDASAQSYMSMNSPVVKLMEVKRTVHLTPPHSVVIGVEKKVYQKMAMALKTLGGSWLTNKDDRMALGMPAKFPTDDPKLMLARKEYENFMSHMNIRIQAANNAIRRGSNTTNLMHIIRHAPPLYTLPRHKRYANIMERGELVRRLRTHGPQLMFGVNKAILGMTTAERNGMSAAMREAFQLYTNNTDNSGALDGLDGWFDGVGAPFRTPNCVVVTTDRLIKKLMSQGICYSSDVDMHQVMSLLSLTQEDMNPLRTVAPQMSVQLRGGSYVRDPNRQVAKHIHTVNNHRLIYSRMDNVNAIYVAVDDGSFADEVAKDCNMTTMTTFDFMMPCGITFTQGGKLIGYGPVQQTTTFANQLGARYTVGCEAVKSFLTSLFNGSNNTFVYPNTDMDNEDIKGCMLFYDFLSDDEQDENTGGRLMKLNEMMSDNHYYNDDLMAMNIISVLLNATAPVLKDLLFNDDGTDDGETSEDGIFKDSKFNTKMILSIVENYMARSKYEYTEALAIKVYKKLRNLTNTDAIACLKYINMGFGLTLVKPEFVQADSMLLCKPFGFSSLDDVPSQTRTKDVSDEKQNVLYQTSAHSAICRQSLAGYPAVMWRNAMMAESQASTTDKVLDVTREDEIDDHLAYQRVMRMSGMENKTLDPRVKGDGWWPMFSPPFMDIETFGSAGSPWVV